MRTLSSEISTHLENDTVFFIDLVEIDLGVSTLRFARYPSELDSGTVLYEAFDGNRYFYRVVSVGNLPFTVGAESDSTEIELDNTDRYFTNLLNENVIFEGARVKIHRFFPTLEEQAIENWWTGRIVKYSLTRSIFTIEVAFGFNNLHKRALRRYGSSCHNLFADGHNCPYDPLKGKGWPNVYVDGTATGGTSSTLSDSSENFTSIIEKGHLVFVKSKKIIGIVTNVSSNTLTVDKWRKGGSPTGFTPSNGDEYIVGPAHKTCSYSKDACIVRGMFGQNGKQDESDLNTDTRRYIAATLQPAKQEFQGRARSQSGKVERYSKTPDGNEGLDGNPIPVIAGDFRVKSADFIGATVAEAPDTNYVHALFVISEGRCQNIDVISMDGVPVDNDDAAAPDNDGPLITYGVEFGANDQGAVGGDLTQLQQKQAIGSRESYSWRRRVELDTYLSNPRLFNDENGDGVSLNGLAAVRVRTEAGNEANENPTLLAEIRGVFCRLPSDSEPQDVDTSNPNTTTYTTKPTPVQLAYEFMRNERWGLGLSDNDIDLDAIRNESDYCREQISVTQSLQATHGGTVAYGPNQQTRAPVSGGKNWIAVFDLDRVAGQSFVGGTLRIRSRGINAKISSIFEDPYVNRVDPSGQPGIYPEEEFQEQRAVFILVNEDFSEIPGPGDQYELHADQKISRFMANGELRSDVEGYEMLQSILDNCDGTFIIADGKIRVVIPKKLSESELEDLDDELLITDKGTNPTVIYRNGESTLNWEPHGMFDAPNEVSVKFVDRQSDWQSVELTVKNNQAQRILGQNFGENRRDRQNAKLSLALCHNRDQAARIATRRLRRNGFVLGMEGAGPFRTGKITFDLPIHYASELRPVEDVRKIASDTLPDYIQFCRIMKITENEDRITCNIEAIPYIGWQYEDTADDFGVVTIPDDVSDPTNEMPRPVIVDALEDVGYYGNDGIRRERVKVTLRLPQ